MIQLRLLLLWIGGNFIPRRALPPSINGCGRSTSHSTFPTTSAIGVGVIVLGRKKALV